jgi:DNA-binding Lrp family transcriptional regulator
MDTYRSASEAAQELGTNVPRLLRHARKLGLRLRKRTVRGVARYLVSDEQFAALRRELGVVRETGGLSRLELQVLAALARSPRGLLSARAVARRARVSPTGAAEAIRALEERGLVEREPVMVALGRAHEAEIIRARPHADAWRDVADSIDTIRLPAARPTPARRVPPELRHLFWNTAPGQLDLDRAGGYIARRLIQLGDIDGLAWGAEQLKADDWKHALGARGLDPRKRALAANLAAASDE